LGTFPQFTGLPCRGKQPVYLPSKNYAQFTTLFEEKVNADALTGAAILLLQDLHGRS
jgi:hypothetical protein